MTERAIQRELVDQLAGEINSAWDVGLEDHRRVGVHASNYAGSLADPCERRLFYWRTEGDKAERPSKRTAALFKAGKMLEPRIRRMLLDLGCEVTSPQRGFYQNDYQIGARLDGETSRGGLDFAVEIKTINGADFDTITQADDPQRAIAESPKQWLRNWSGQFQVYMLMTDREAMLVVLYDKWGGRLRAITVTADVDLQEQLLEKADRVNQAVDMGEPPAGWPPQTECLGCPFLGRTCEPPWKVEAGARIISDAELLEDLREREDHHDAHRHFNRLDRTIRDRLKRTIGSRDLPPGGEIWLAGDFAIQVVSNQRSPGVSIRIHDTKPGDEA